MARPAVARSFGHFSWPQPWGRSRLSLCERKLRNPRRLSATSLRTLEAVRFGGLGRFSPTRAGLAPITAGNMAHADVAEGISGRVVSSYRRTRWRPRRGRARRRRRRWSCSCPSSSACASSGLSTGSRPSRRPRSTSPATTPTPSPAVRAPPDPLRTNTHTPSRDGIPTVSAPPVWRESRRARGKFYILVSPRIR
eukprot:631009-Prorocentrum_minimum.AAC.1